MFRFLLPLVCAVTVFTTACSSNYNADEVPDVSPEALYQVAQGAMASGDYTLARRYLEALDSRYPFGALSEQVQLDLIYVYYKSRESELTSAQIARFQRLSPTSPNADYVMFMKGLNQIQMRSDLIQDFLGLNRSQKDPTHYYEAIKTFKELIATYPNSLYVTDAYQRIIYLRGQLAEREYEIAKFYNAKQAYVSSIRHCQNILFSYRGTEYLDPALELMTENYAALGLPVPAGHTASVAKASFSGR